LYLIGLRLSPLHIIICWKKQDVNKNVHSPQHKIFPDKKTPRRVVRQGAFDLLNSRR